MAGTGVILEKDIAASNARDPIAVLRGRPLIVSVPVRNAGQDIGTSRGLGVGGGRGRRRGTLPLGGAPPGLELGRFERLGLPRLLGVRPGRPEQACRQHHHQQADAPRQREHGEALPCLHAGRVAGARRASRPDPVKPGQRPRLAAQLFGSSTSRPPRCGRSAAGMRMLPSFCWCTSSNAISTRGVAMTVLFNV